MSSLEKLISVLEDCVVKTTNAEHNGCQSFFISREVLKVGSGVSTKTEKNKGMVITAEAAIGMASPASQSCQCVENCAVTKVLYYQDFNPFLIPTKILNAFKKIEWKSYGLVLESSTVNGDGHAVLQWENTPSSPRIYIAINSYHNKALQPTSKASADGKLVKNAVKSAMDDLKAKHPHFFLSSNVMKIREYVPEISRSIAELVISSNDAAFRTDCTILLGIHPSEAGLRENLVSNIHERIMKVIEMNEAVGNAAAEPGLFERNIQFEEELLDAEDNEEEDVQMLD